MGGTTITINRTPVLALWAAVVAERLGFNREESLSLGKARAGLHAKAKGRHADAFKPDKGKLHQVRDKSAEQEFRIELCGRPVAARNTDDGIRAVRGTQSIDPDSVEHYLESQFGEALGRVFAAMRGLARSYPPGKLAAIAQTLFERFRPDSPQGVRGWGAMGELDVALIERLADKRQ